MDKSIALILVVVLAVAAVGGIYMISNTGDDGDETDPNILLHGNGGNYSGVSEYTAPRSDGVPEYKFTNNDLTFSYWNTKADGTGTTYRYLDSADNEALKNSKVTDLYAIWNYTLDATFKIIDYESSFLGPEMIIESSNASYPTQDFNKGVFLDPNSNTAKVTVTNGYQGVKWTLDEANKTLSTVSGDVSVKVKFSEMTGFELTSMTQTADGIAVLMFSYSGNAVVTVTTTFVSSA